MSVYPPPASSLDLCDLYALISLFVGFASKCFQSTEQIFLTFKEYTVKKEMYFVVTFPAAHLLWFSILKICCAQKQTEEVQPF